MSKEISFPSGTPGKCIVPVCNSDNLHEFGLYDKDNNQLHTAYFSSMEKATQKAKVEFPDLEFTIKDLDEEWYVKKAMEYRQRIKKLHPSFKLTGIILDMSKMYYSRSVNDWYTYIPFTYQDVKWNYRETPDGKEWVHKAPEIKKEKKTTLEDIIMNAQKEAATKEDIPEKEGKMVSSRDKVIE